MRNIKYILEPEAYGYDGSFINKTAPIADLIIDTGMLIHADFDKVIPEFEILNKLLLKGYYPRSGEWEPFSLTPDEYDELVDYLISLPLNKPFRVEKRFK